jgi:hypothetical protein
MQMVNALRNTPNSMSMESLKECIDPNLMDLYPRDCLFKVYYFPRCLKCIDPHLKELTASNENLTHAGTIWQFKTPFQRLNTEINSVFVFILFLQFIPKMATLAKRCVDDDPVLRPDMKQAVISLSQILLSSIEWEATLAGNSQIFSGLVQGR